MRLPGDHVQLLSAKALPKALIVISSCLKCPWSLGTGGFLTLPCCEGLAINLLALFIPSRAGFLQVSGSSWLQMAFSPLRWLLLHLGAEGTWGWCSHAHLGSLSLLMLNQPEVLIWIQCCHPGSVVWAHNRKL